MPKVIDEDGGTCPAGPELAKRLMEIRGRWLEARRRLNSAKHKAIAYDEIVKVLEERCGTTIGDPATSVATIKNLFDVIERDGKHIDKLQGLCTWHRAKMLDVQANLRAYAKQIENNTEPI